MYGDGGAAANNSHLHHHQFSPQQTFHQSPTPQLNHHHQPSAGGLTRFSSAPTSFFQTLLDDDITSFIASRSADIPTPTPPPHHSFIKHETQPPPSPPVNFDLPSTTSNNGFSAPRNTGVLLRQTSSPADFFSSLFDDDDAVGFSSYRGNAQAPHVSTNVPMPSIPEFQQQDSVSELLSGIFEKSDVYDECWQGNASLTGKRRTGDSGNEIMFGAPNQNGYSSNASNGLIHQMSLPNTSSELAAVDKYLQFQDSSTPCSNTRAKRGFATHPRSIAERVRRTKISDRMRKLQQLFPDIDKQTNTAQMLDMATDYIKDLEKEVQTLKDTREKCICLKR